MATSVTTITEEWLEKARAFAPLVEQYRDDAERERHLPQPLFEAIRQRGIFNLAVPRAFGGLQVPLETLAEVVEEFSRQDGSVGWNVVITAAGGFFADYLPEDGARGIYGDGTSVAVGSFAPSGQAAPEAGGYRVSGRWAFASGCHNANWLMGGFVTMENGQPRLGPDGRPYVKIMFMPVSDCEILDTWYTAGMRGTGSHDFVVSEKFVPENRSFPVSQFFTGPPPRPSLGYPYPFMALAGPFLAVVSLGIARDAIESFKALAMTKTPRGGQSTLAQQHTVHDKVGRAEALVRSARAYLYETLRLIDASAPDPEATTELLASARLAGAHVAKSSVEAVDLMFDAGGGTSIYTDSRLERCFRDAHTITHHWIVSASSIEMVGQYLLGLGLQMRR